MVSQDIAVFANKMRCILDEACYLAIMPNDEGYDIEVEANEGTIAGIFATHSDDVENAREVADCIHLVLEDWGIKVYKTRRKWENYLFNKKDK